MNGPDQKFVPSGASAPFKEGLVLERKTGKARSYERITHVFALSVYCMPIGAPADARYAKRPRRRRLVDLKTERKKGQVTLGQLSLPPEFTRSIPKGSDEDATIEAALLVLKPLLESFESEKNLDRSKFTLLIDTRAEKLQRSNVSLRRLLLRYWYFGKLRTALLSLSKGPAPGTTQAIARPASLATGQARKRPGRKSDLSAELGPNEFIVGGEDIADIIASVTREAREAAAARKEGAAEGTVSQAYRHWLHNGFKKRHPELHARWMAGKHDVPLSESQFRRYVTEYEELEDDLRQAMPALDHERSERMLKSSGPGDVYELDATGGQIALVDSKDSSKVLATPLIYILIDRWSRFVVSVYITLRPASWEALRVAMRIAFTSRARRTAHFGKPIDDAEWPVGVPPAQIFVDRGSEMISESMLHAAVDGLGIVPQILPPLTPDGKGIVENVIKVLKRKLKNKRIPGLYDKQVMDPKRRSAKKQARVAAVYTLAELYRVLLAEVVRHNNKNVHSWLKRRSILKVNGVPPRPRDAFLWGLENLTGVQRPPYTEDDYKRIFLGIGEATLNGSIMTYEGRHYVPANDAAKRLAPSVRPKKYRVHVDVSDPYELYVGNSRGEWPKWKVNEAGADDLSSITLEEQSVLRTAHRSVIARAMNDALRSADEDAPPRRPARKAAVLPAEPLSPAETRRRRLSESNSLDRALDGKPTPAPARKDEASTAEQLANTMAKLEELRREQLVEANRKRRKE